MSARSLNLLRYPGRIPTWEGALLRPVLVAWLAGVLSGLGWSGWQHMRHDEWLALHARLQAQTQALAGQQTEAAARQLAARLHQAFLERARAWKNRRERVLHLQAVLTEQARSTGLRVERWQSDGRRLVLQAWLPRAEHVPQLVAHLSAAWPQAWTLQSLSDRTGAGAGVDVVLEAPWDDAVQGNGKTAP